MTTLTTRLLQLLFLSFLIAIALGMNYLHAWTGPTATAPSGNVDAPLNIGTENQVKDANLSVGHSANTASDFGLISYGKIRSTIGGIQFPDGTVQTTAGGGSSVVQEIYSDRNDTVTSGSVQIPLDNTIPQSTEGYQIFSQTITPQSTNSTIEIETEVYMGEVSNVSDDLIVAHFESGTANALTTSMLPNYHPVSPLSHLSCGPVRTITRVSNTSLSPRTFTVRGATNASAQIRLNGCGSTGLFGGTLKSWIRISEISN